MESRREEVWVQSRCPRNPPPEFAGKRRNAKMGKNSDVSEDERAIGGNEGPAC